MTTVGPISVANNTDDGYRVSTGGFDSTASEAYCGNIGGSTYDFWCTFRGITATQGATINSATLLITPSTSTNGTAQWKCRAVAADDQGPPANASAYNAFSWTTATVTGSATTSAAVSINVATIMQELVNRAGWAGDKVTFQFADNGSSTSNWMYPAPLESATQEARLTVDYTPAAGGGTSKNLLTLGVG